MQPFDALYPWHMQLSRPQHARVPPSRHPNAGRIMIDDREIHAEFHPMPAKVRRVEPGSAARLLAADGDGAAATGRPPQCSSPSGPASPTTPTSATASASAAAHDMQAMTVWSSQPTLWWGPTLQWGPGPAPWGPVEEGQRLVEEREVQVEVREVAVQSGRDRIGAGGSGGGGASAAA